MRTFTPSTVMAKVEAGDGMCDQDPQKGNRLEERTINVRDDSTTDQAAKTGVIRGKKHKLKWMSRPMVLPETILEFLDEDLRENAIRYLSNFLVEEIVGFYKKMEDEKLDSRSIKRLINVLTLFQSVAANNETRQRFVDACGPNFLVPLILFKSTNEVFEDVRTIALSVFGILCQGRESRIIKWAIENDIIEVCHCILENGSELSKVIAMHILEAILHDNSGISFICDPTCTHVLDGLIRTWNGLVNLLAVDQDFSPRLLFHSIRCYIILCRHDKGYDAVKNNLPEAIANGSFHEMTEKYPMIRELLHQLLLNVGKEAEVHLSEKW
ncbi:cell differentiation protein rcd1-like isoform X2 [Musa acuminata AAA Group]|uniref:cell differentiation protein rcd1-like isoform X2 n=1 Tax=Musa acuminata AAA Group TaxID=214697 RepID=UPI0031CE4B15